MSFAALQIAVRDRLRTNFLVLDSDNDVFQTLQIDNQVGLQKEGMPPPAAGQFYVGIHGATWNPGQTEQDIGIEEVYGVNVTVTARTPFVPKDRQADAVYAGALTGLDRIIRWIMVSIHQDYTLITDANTNVGTDKFVEPLRWQGNDPEPVERGEEWFNAVDGRGKVPSGWSMTAKFGDARRFQGFDVIE